MTQPEFDPADHTVEEVQQHLKNASPDERDRVLAQEKKGSGRKGVMSAPEPSGDVSYGVASNLQPEETEADVVARNARDEAIDRLANSYEDPEAGERVYEQYERMDRAAQLPPPTVVNNSPEGA